MEPDETLRQAISDNRSSGGGGADGGGGGDDGGRDGDGKGCDDRHDSGDDGGDGETVETESPNPSGLSSTAKAGNVHFIFLLYFFRCSIHLNV